MTRLVRLVDGLCHFFQLITFQFEGIQKLEGHHGEIWALALSHHGNFVVTGSHDKSIRVWEKLDEPVWGTDLPVHICSCSRLH